MAWSEAQLTAIQEQNKNLLVAAAAGSGKTSVLVERIIRRVLDEKHGYQIDEVLVVTFTNAAAAEMRERIGGAIELAIKAHPESQHLERQMILLSAASISTLHAFCQSVIRQNFHLLDLDPKFRLASEQEMNLLKRDVLAALFETHYAAGDAAFLDFVDHYGNERGDEELYALLLRLYDFSCSQPYPEAWLTELPQHFSTQQGVAVDATVWAELLKAELQLIFTEGVAQSRALLRSAEAVGFDFYASIFGGDAAIFEELLRLIPCGWDKLRRAVYAVKFQTLRAPKDADEELKEFFAKKRNRLKDKLKLVKENYFIADGDALIADLRAVRPMVEAICRLTVDFAADFAAAKQAKAVVDFNDLEHFCLRILRGEDATPECMTASPVARALQEKYREVMVDEYQDTNGVQEAILSLLRKPDTPNLFLVGDVKQSIYRFRLAEPELFLEKYRSYPLRGGNFARIDLAQNFRSRPGVLAAINFIFSQVMSPQVAELSYGEAERLNPGPDYPGTDRPNLAGAVELQLLDRDDTAEEGGDLAGEDALTPEERRGFALEAQFIAQRLTALMAEQVTVFDKDKKEYRPLAWRDIVILLRSVKNKADVLLETLKNQNIPAYASVDAGYFQEIEVQIMLALLQTIDNPRQDIPLASVLYSPIVSLSAAELAALRLLEPEGVLFDALLRAGGAEADLPLAAKEKATQFILRLNQWRNLARRKSVPELVWQLLGDTGYYDYVGGMPGGMLRQANLRMLYDRARQYEMTNFRGLFRFLRFIEKMRDAGTDLAVARTLGESENVVRIMSIHKSKGLEFPVVVVADLGKKFNLQDSKATLLIHKKFGLGPFVTDAALNLRYPTIARQAIAGQMNRDSKAEELRVLYVALTRAREKLILVGSASRLAAKANDWCQYAASEAALLPDYAIAGAGSYLDWICAAVARHADGAALRGYGGCADQHVNWLRDESAWQVAITPASDILQRAAQGEVEAEFLQKIAGGERLPGGSAAAGVEQVLDWRYADIAAQSVPAKLSVTEMKRRFASLDETAAPIFQPPLLASRPRFIRDRTALTGAEYGTLMHSIMQHVDLRGDLSENGLREQIAAFARREILLPEQLDCVDLPGICHYFADGIGRRMVASPRVRRELPFSVMLDAKRFYPELSAGAERIFVQGIVDVLFDEADGMVLVDYKTDDGRDLAGLADKYRMQLNLYAEAIERIFGRKVKEKYLYLLSAGRAIAIE